MTVENGDADVTIDQQEKRIDVTFYAYCDLSEVLVSFDLIEGAQMFIPYLKDTVYMDLSKEKGATVAARVDGQTVVYTMFATIEYALAGVQVKAGMSTERSRSIGRIGWYALFLTGPSI